MNIYLAGCQSRPYVFELCKSISQAKMENGASCNNYGGGMNIYLAGGITGNCFPIWKKIANGGGGYNDEYLFSGRTSREERQICERGGQLILESFYYCRKNPTIPKLLPNLGDFMLDSGAFTFMSGADRVDWDAYVDEYAEWINTYKINKFFELDIDSVVGLKEVERLRARLESRTGKQPIPVWHKSRGVDYYKWMIRNYPYIALGGIALGRKDKKTLAAYFNLFPWFIKQAHEVGSKIHGLGFTSVELLKKYHFDSVDSTAWLYGNRAGYLYKFDPNKGNFDKIEAPAGHRLSSQAAALHNFNEWIKFQQYAKINL